VSDASAPTLHAVTRRLDVEADLLAFAGDDGPLWTRGRSGLAGRGEVLRIEVPRVDPTTAAKAVHDALDQIVVDDEVQVPGTGPVALGALPFDVSEPGVVVVPELVLGRADDGTRWLTAITPTGAEPVMPDLASAPVIEPRSFRVESERAVDDWCADLVALRDALRAGEADKVVLARAVRVEAEAPLSRRAIVERLRAAYPACMLSAIDGFVGASPELLVARAGDVVRCHPMAGTAPRSDDPSTDAGLAASLIASTKDQREHRLTIDMVHDTLLPWCSYIDEEAEPSIVAMANVQHLATLVEGRLSSPPASVIELVTALHPTPAVGGSPRGAALELMARHEHLDRGRYGGPVGWVDASGNGAWAVGIRSAEVHGSTARLFAGVGVLPGSDVEAELAETRAKLQALLGAIVRP
jgi:menaquinone-specific isochorismate synthase